MKYLLSFFAILLTLTFSCDQKTAAVEDQAETSEETLTPNADENSENVAAMPAEIQEKTTTEYEAVAREAVDNFPLGQRVEFTSAMLKPLCTNKYGCLEETIYPIGWSMDGKFAYLIEEANEAVAFLTLHFIIQDIETDKQLVKNTFKASEQPGNHEEGHFSVKNVWADREEEYNQLITDHKISAGNGTQFYSLTEAKADWPYGFTSNNKKKRNEMFDLEFVSEHQLQATQQGVGKKTILKHTFGKYDLALATQPLGYFRSPFEERVAVVDAFEKRGYEGPPNVLKLMVVGCKLGEGFK